MTRTWPRFVGAGIAIGVALFLLLGVLLGGLNRDAMIERVVAAVLAGLSIGGALLLLLRQPVVATINLLAALVLWIAWDLATAPDAIRSSIVWMGALAIAAGLAWNTGRGPR